MSAAVQDNPRMKTVREYIARAESVIDTLHLGPLDYNVTSAVDYLRTAAKVLEALGAEYPKAEG